MSGLDISINETEKTQIQTELRSLLLNQKELVVKLNLVYLNFSRTLADVDFSLNQLVTLGAKFKHYLNQRLLWVPSAPVIDQHYVLEIFDTLVWLVSSPGWQQALIDTKDSVQNSSLLVALGFA